MRCRSSAPLAYICRSASHSVGRSSGLHSLRLRQCHAPSGSPLSRLLVAQRTDLGFFRSFTFQPRLPLSVLGSSPFSCYVVSPRPSAATPNVARHPGPWPSFSFCRCNPCFRLWGFSVCTYSALARVKGEVITLSFFWSLDHFADIFSVCAPRV